MHCRLLDRTGVRASVLCLGNLLFGPRPDEQAEWLAFLGHALDAGINFLDTANVSTRGHSEEVTGEALCRLGKRQRVVLATKVHGTIADCRQI